MAMINEEYALFSCSNISVSMVQILYFFHYEYFCSFSNPSSINYSVLYTPNSVAFKMMVVGNLGIFKIRIEKRISFIVGIANKLILEGKL